MLLHSRNLLLFIALSGTALATWMVAREPQAPSADSQRAREGPRGHYSEGAVLLRTDGDGKIRERIKAARLEQLPDSDELLVEEIRIEYTEESQLRWRFAAEHASMPKDLSSFELRGVLATFTGDDPATFETPSLTLDAEASVASTEAEVVFRQARTTTQGVGMMLDLENETFRLLHDATSQTVR